MSGRLVAFVYRLRNRIDVTAVEARRRDAASVFYLGVSRRADRFVAALYFTLSALSWQAKMADPGHLAAFRAGLERCRAPQRVLDLGTGSGDVAALIAERYPRAEVVAVDYSRRMLRLARARHRQPNLTFRRALVERLPFPDASFDLVVLVNVSPEPFELRRVLAPGGQVFEANSFFPAHRRPSSWLARLEEAGLVHESGESVGAGAYAIYGAAEPKPWFARYRSARARREFVRASARS